MPSSARSFSVAAAALVACIVAAPEVEAAAPPARGAEAFLQRQLRELVALRDQAFAALDARRAQNPRADFRQTAEYQELQRIQTRIEVVQAKLDRLRHGDKETRLRTLRRREAELRAQLDRIARDPSVPEGGVLTHPRYAEWRETRREIASLEAELGADAPRVDQVRLTREPTSGPYSPGLARGLSLGTWLGITTLGTLMIVVPDSDPEVRFAGAAIASFGMSWGPSFGHYYTGQAGRATWMGFLRMGAYAAGAGAVVGGLIVGFGSGDTEDVIGLMMGVAAPMLGLGVALSIIDVVDSGRSAVRANKRRSRVELTSMGPGLLRGREGDLVPALTLAGRF